MKDGIVRLTATQSSSSKLRGDSLLIKGDNGCRTLWVGIVPEDLTSRSRSMVTFDGGFLGGGKASVHCVALTFICVIALSAWPRAHCQSLSEKTLRAKAQFLTAEVPMSY